MNAEATSAAGTGGTYISPDIDSSAAAAREATMTGLNGVRVLVVEDEPLLLFSLQDMLASLGCVVAGTAGRLDASQQLATNLEFDVAVLDINLGGVRVDTVADMIAARGLPFVFVTGYGRDGAPQGSAPVLEKPYEAAGLQRALAEALGR